VNVWFTEGDRRIVRRTVRVKSLLAAGQAAHRGVWEELLARN
jgi:hypothetical protein